MTAEKLVKSLNAVKMMGSQTPSERTAPTAASSDGGDAAAVLAAGGVLLDEWQELVLRDWMGRTATGRWAAPTCGGSVPRQNGKSLLVQARAIAGMLLLNEQVIYTAHLQKTATETFEEMRDFFESAKIKRYVREIKSAIGREQIILKSGARVKFLARTRNGGRGQHGDLLIFDEAQDLEESAQASFLPAISASMNPQTVYTGTPPEGVSDGTVFRNIRERALGEDNTRIAWFEFSVAEIGDTSDRERWAATNPALGRRIQLDTIISEQEQLPADMFARERLGWWNPIIEVIEQPVIDPEAWGRCRSTAPKPDGKTAYGVKFSPDGTEVILAGAVIDKETNTVRVTIIDRRDTAHGIQWLAEWLNERYKVASCVVIDGRNGVDLLIDKIGGTWRMKGSILKPNARDAVAAASMFINEINESTLTWYHGQEDLDDSARTATKRPIGGGFGFGGDNALPVEAAALALYGVRTAKRDPSRKMMIG